MVDIPPADLLSFLIFLGTVFFLSSIARKINISLITGYIVSGIILGNLFQRFYSHTVINNFAYFGIVLLLFTLGLEINFRQLIDLKKFIVVGGSIQMLASVIFISLISLVFQFPPLTAILIGLALSSSSTAIVAKIIQDRGEEGSFLGELALGILMFQDLAFIPFLIIFTAITEKQTSFFPLLAAITVSLIKSTIIIACLYYAGQKLIPVIFNGIARMSREVFNFFIIFFIIFVIYLAELFKISPLIGAFIAGILVGQTHEQHHIFSQVRSVRDILAIIFFVFIGLNLNLALITYNLPKLILFSFFVIAIKALVILIIFLLMRFHTKTAFSLALLLFQIDEDAFILMSQAHKNQIINNNEFSFIIGTVILGLISTPFLIRNKDRFYYYLRRLIKKRFPIIETFIEHRLDQDRSPLDILSLKDHIVLCGYGRVGRYIGRALMLADIPFIAIDYNYQVVENAKKEGVNIIYGDPSDYEILDYAQADEARAIISVVPDALTQEMIIINAKKLNPKIYIFNRIAREGEQQRFRDLGAEVVVHPEFEAALSIIRKILYWRGIDKEEIARKIKRLKIEHGMT